MQAKEEEDWSNSRLKKRKTGPVPDGCPQSELGEKKKKRKTGPVPV